MKLSLALTVLILITTAVLNSHANRRIAAFEETHAKLVLQAGQPGPAPVPSAPDRLADGGKDRALKEARMTTTRLLTFAKEMTAFKLEGQAPDEILFKRSADIMTLLQSLNPAQLKLIIPETLAYTDIEETTRQGMLYSFLTLLGKKAPRDALEILTNSPGVFTKDAKPAEVVADALANWAGTDPTDATRWIKDNSPNFPGLITESAKLAILTHAAARDAGAAFDLVGDLGFTDKMKALATISGTAATTIQRRAMLTSLRGYLAGIPDEKERHDLSQAAIQAIAPGVIRDGFDSASQWLASAELSPVEMEGFTATLPSIVEGSETGAWITWIGNTLPAGKSEAAIRHLLTKWTEQDHKAAGQWLNTLPGSPAKNVSISAFAETVAQFEPEAALQWGRTLPPGPEKEATLKKIEASAPKQVP